jgi:PAS domain S-box-containing protein
LVDDDRLSRRVIAANLTGGAYEVREAVNGQHALEIAAEWAPDLVLLDALMPVMDGYTCCENLRAMPELTGCLILMLTGVDEDASIDRAFAVGASDYLTKPVRPRALRNRIGYLVRAQQVEQRVRRSKREWEATFDAVTDLIVLVDEHGTIIRCNRAAAERLGGSYAAVLGQSLSARLGLALDHPVWTQPDAVGDVRFPGLDGWHRMYAYDMPDDVDTVRHVYVLRNVTARKEAEDRLRASESRQRALLQALPDLLFVHDRSGRFVDYHVNQISDLLLPPDQFMGRLVSEVAPVELYPEFAYHLERAWQSSSVVTFEMPLMVADGQSQFCEFRMMKAGEDRMLTIVRDITARRQAEEDLRASQAEFRSLFEEAPVMYLRLRHDDDELVIIQANRAFLDGLGYQREEVLGRPLDQFYTEDSIRALREVGLRISSREPFTAERQLLTKDGQVIDAVLKTVPECDRAGVVTGTRAMLTDVTALKQLQRQIESSQKLADLGTLAAGVAHEMNSPLQVITGMSHSLLRTLERDARSPERLKTSLEMINRNAWRCAEISRALRTYAHSSGGALLPYSLSDVVKDALLLTEHQLRAWSNIEVVTDLADALPEVACDRNQIAQVVINLLTNARDAMPQGGEIRIRTYVAEEGQVALSVVDTGEGIPDSIRTKIFNPFFTTKAVGTGTGLGLSIIDGIVKAHGGRIALTSVVNQGTTFEIVFPAHNASPAVQVETLPVEVKGRFDAGTVVTGRPDHILTSSF